MALESINPTTGELNEVFDEWSPEKVRGVIGGVDEAFQRWRLTGFPERSDRMRAAAALLRREAGRFARLMAEEMGKPLVEGRAEAEKCAWVCDYYAEHGASFLAAEPAESDGSEAFVAFRPLGTVLAVMPWNFPFWQVFRFAAPALMAGNTALLKHSSNVPRCALAVEKLFRDAGFPSEVFRTLMIGSGQVAAVIEDPRVKAVTLTGSDAAGREVAGQAGSAVKKTVLELGGSDPFIVLDDADLEQAATVGAKARTINSGQSCIAAKRFIVVEQVRDAFLDRFRTSLEGLKVGDPLQEQTDIGPQARGDLREMLHEQVEASVARGAKLLLGGRPSEGPGYFYPPTLLTDVAPGMAAFDEELFGPVAAVITVRDTEEAIAVANATRYGLGASLWSGALERAKQVAGRLEAGSVFINGLVKSDPRLPFGGIKASGYGRELSRYGIREFVNIQTVWVK